MPEDYNPRTTEGRGANMQLDYTGKITKEEPFAEQRAAIREISERLIEAENALVDAFVRIDPITPRGLRTRLPNKFYTK